MTRPIRLVLILLFALLQTVAPLLHAHSASSSAVQGALHLPAAAPTLLSTDADTWRAELRSDGGAVIGIAEELRHDPVLALSHAPVGVAATRAVPQSSLSALARSQAASPPPRSAFDHALPMAQAPPLRA